MKKPVPTIEFGEMWSEGETVSENHERWGNHWAAWIYWVFVLEDASRTIGESTQFTKAPGGQITMPAVYAVRAMLLGYAIECALKCYWVKFGNKIVDGGRFVGVRGAGADHNLVQLGRTVGFQPTQRESDVLTRLSKFIRFAGRYPISKHPDEMAPRDFDGLAKLDVGFFSKADFRTCISILNKILSMISGKKRRSFQPLGTPHYLVRADRAASRRRVRGK